MDQTQIDADQAAVEAAKQTEAAAEQQLAADQAALATEQANAAASGMQVVTTADVGSLNAVLGDADAGTPPVTVVEDPAPESLVSVSAPIMHNLFDRMEVKAAHWGGAVANEFHQLIMEARSHL